MEQQRCRCGKLAYETRNEADRVFRLIKRRKRRAEGLEVYRCDEGCWHLGRSYVRTSGRRRRGH